MGPTPAQLDDNTPYGYDGADPGVGSPAKARRPPDRSIAMTSATSDAPNVEHVSLIAPDISCGHCVQTVQSELGKLDGVSNVHASAETKTIDLDFDAAVVSLGKIEAILDEAGYPVQR